MISLRIYTIRTRTQDTTEQETADAEDETVVETVVVYAQRVRPTGGMQPRAALAKAAARKNHPFPNPSTAVQVCFCKKGILYVVKTCVCIFVKHVFYMFYKRVFCSSKREK